MKTLFIAMLMVTVALAAAAQTTAPAHDDSLPIFLKYQDLKWDKLRPELGEGSPKITILHSDPKTGATQLLIWSPKNYHAPRHWHTANEMHAVISGSFVMQHDGSDAIEDLGPGSFNFMPSKMVHQAWSKPDVENLVFITLDGPWDIHWMDDPGPEQIPTPKQP
jgi:mannose-6-phosphate isomerase-like protein (cupin superfamily)